MYYQLLPQMKNAIRARKDKMTVPFSKMDYAVLKALADGNQQAFVPSVAVAANGTVAVAYYDFRNNTTASGLTTDYWLVHAGADFTNIASWTTDEKRLTDASFDMEVAPRTGQGYFVGDYAGLAAAGNNFYALFAGHWASSSHIMCRPVRRGP